MDATRTVSRKGKGTRKRLAAIAAVAAAALMIGAPSIAEAAPHGRDNDRGRSAQRHDGNRHESRRHDRDRRHDRHDDRHRHRRHARHDRNDSRFGLSIVLGSLFNSPRRATHTYVERSWVGGHWDVQHIPAVYETRYQPCGTPYQVMVRPARSERVWVPGHYVETTRTHSSGAHRSGARIVYSNRY